MLFLVGLALCAAIGVPLFAVIGVAALMSFLDLPRGQASAVAIDVLGDRLADNYSLAAIPLFLLAGRLLAASRAPARLIAVASAWLAPRPGGLALACVFVSVLLGALCGGSGLALGAAGGLLLPLLLGRGYPEPLALGLTTSSGALGVLLPPSAALILYAAVARVYLDPLLLAGAATAVVMALLFGLYGARQAVKSRVERPAFDREQARSALRDARWELALPVFLLWGLWQGLLRVHEAAAFTALYVLVLEVWVKRELALRDVARIAVESGVLVGAILIVLAAAIGWNAYLHETGTPEQLLALLLALTESRAVFLPILSALLIGGGMLLGSVPMLVLSVPVILPLASAYGVEWFPLALIVLLSLEIGCLLPPLGQNLLGASARFGRPVEEVKRAVLPFAAVLWLLALIGASVL